MKFTHRETNTYEDEMDISVDEMQRLNPQQERNRNSSYDLEPLEMEVY